MYQNNPVVPVNTLPTMYDLPSEDPEEMGLPDKFHDLQPHLLSETCVPAIEKKFIGIDLNLYYDVLSDLARTHRTFFNGGIIVAWY
jgi:hypothetical protein